MRKRVHVHMQTKLIELFIPYIALHWWITYSCEVSYRSDYYLPSYGSFSVCECANAHVRARKQKNEFFSSSIAQYWWVTYSCQISYRSDYYLPSYGSFTDLVFANAQTHACAHANKSNWTFHFIRSFTLMTYIFLWSFVQIWLLFTELWLIHRFSVCECANACVCTRKQ